MGSTTEVASICMLSSVAVNNVVGEIMVLENEPSKGRVDRSLDGNELGYDELNLAEFALASVSERFLDGSKTGAISSVLEFTGIFPLFRDGIAWELREVS